MLLEDRALGPAGHVRMLREQIISIGLGGVQGLSGAPIAMIGKVSRVDPVLTLEGHPPPPTSVLLDATDARHRSTAFTGGMKKALKGRRGKHDESVAHGWGVAYSSAIALKDGVQCLPSFVQLVGRRIVPYAWGMRKPTTDQLLQDLLAIHFEVQRHVQDRRHRLTPLQVQVLAGSVTSFNRFLIAWQTATAKTGTRKKW
ncbi:MAG: hypothetical protein LZF60_160147 [Nitrospira sp.]|nr:MAG: hypothetical protein LZF60_160147 [Nitrospira sp.]